MSEEKIQFEDKMTAGIFVGALVLIAALFVGGGIKLYKHSKEEAKAIALNEARCKELAFIYGDSVKVTDGFYKGQEGTVVDRFGYSDGTAMKIDLKGGTGTVISVKCKDLAR